METAKLALETIIRNAETGDYPPVAALLRNAKLPLDGVEEHLSHFLVLSRGDEIIGAVGLEIYGDKALLRSLAVVAQEQGKGFGMRLYQAIIQKALEKNVSEIYLLTETAEKFFAARGFRKIPREAADKRVKTSVEFQTACPASAACMRLALTGSKQ